MSREEIPRTPGGENPYVVFGLDPFSSTLKTISKQYKRLAAENHPDAPGGSEEKMVEINTAYKILKENHEKYYRASKRHSIPTQQMAQETQQFYKKMESFRHETLRQSGGIYDFDPCSWKFCSTPAKQWKKFTEDMEKMGVLLNKRFLLACQQGTFFRKARSLAELIARERWLRKGFLEKMWLDIEEMKVKKRSEQEKKRMSVFGQRFDRDMRLKYKEYTSAALARMWRKALRTIGGVVFILLFVFYGIYYAIFKWYWPNTYTMTYKDAI